MKRVGFPQVSLAEVDFQIGAEKMYKMCGYHEARNRITWVRHVGMRRVKSLEEQLSKTVVQDLGVRNF